MTNDNEGVKKLRQFLVETGIYIRAQRGSPLKWQSVDYINLKPEEVQPIERWDEKGWCKILDNIVGTLGAAMVIKGLPVDEKVEVTARDIIVAILSLLEHAGVEAKRKNYANLITAPEP